MRLIKLAIISVIILFLLMLGMSSLIPSHIRISRATDIMGSKDSVAAHVTDLAKWQQWNELVNGADLSNQQFTATTISNSKVIITKEPSQGDTVFTSWKQQNGRILQSGFTWQGIEGHQVLQWYFDIHVNWYPWEKFGSIVFDKQLGPPMEKSLENLKKLVQGNP